MSRIAVCTRCRWWQGTQKHCSSCDVWTANLASMRVRKKLADARWKDELTRLRLGPWPGLAVLVGAGIVPAVVGDLSGPSPGWLALIAIGWLGGPALILLFLVWHPSSRRRVRRDLEPAAELPRDDDGAIGRIVATEGAHAATVWELLVRGDAQPAVAALRVGLSHGFEVVLDDRRTVEVAPGPLCLEGTAGRAVDADLVEMMEALGWEGVLRVRMEELFPHDELRIATLDVGDAVEMHGPLLAVGVDADGYREVERRYRAAGVSRLWLVEDT